MSRKKQDIYLGGEGTNIELRAVADLVSFGTELDAELKKVEKEMAEKTLREIRQESSQFNKYGSGKYARGWGITKQGGYVIHNTVYQLPHLLEYPHPIIAYGKQVAYWSGKAHIKPVEKKMNEEFQQKVDEMIDKGIDKL